MLKNNNQLRNILYEAKFYHSSVEMRTKKTSQCKKHQRVLNFFSEDDHKVLCNLCTKDHQVHLLKSLEEIAAHHSKGIMSSLDLPEESIGCYANFRATQEEK
ncbi:PREDICTED: putative tripartite motif-containing protein 75-like [Elephantulus edwardii]|uniref:putative tripartite motif-containing protein 75-like n=1 Tax=Elephantulus edwardii TaxID=28737 RepID=UPI0003F08D68|nr:PREDICTED: putative tripartite motif-containing protein 75-like [Elephantulus edwardii]